MKLTIEALFLTAIGVFLVGAICGMIYAIHRMIVNGEWAR
jgi:preprotein translocase subunit Sss1